MQGIVGAAFVELYEDRLLFPICCSMNIKVILQMTVKIQEGIQSNDKF